MAKFVEVDLDKSDDSIENMDQNYYHILKPTLYMFRYLGGPTGLWRIYSNRSHIMTIITRVMAFFMLLVINVGTIMGCYVTFQMYGLKKTGFYFLFNGITVIAVLGK